MSTSVRFLEKKRAVSEQIYWPIRCITPLGSLLECFLRADTGAGPVVATAGPAQATALIKQSKSFSSCVLQLIGLRYFQKRTRSGQQIWYLLTYTGYRIQHFGGHLLPYTGDQNWIVYWPSVNLHRVQNSLFWWPFVNLHRVPNSVCWWPLVNLHRVPNWVFWWPPVNLHRVPNFAFWWPSVHLHRVQNLVVWWPSVNLHRVPNWIVWWQSVNLHRVPNLICW